MTSIIANEDLRYSKTREDYLLEEANYHLGVISGASNGLHPIGDIVDND